MTPVRCVQPDEETKVLNAALALLVTVDHEEVRAVILFAVPTAHIVVLEPTGTETAYRNPPFPLLPFLK